MKFLLCCIFIFATNSVFCAIPKAYVTDLEGTTISIIDIESDTVQKIFGFSAPHVVRISTDGQFAYVGDSNDHILKIKCIDQTITTIGNISSHPVALDILPNSTFLYTANDNSTVNIINLTTDTVVGELTGFNFPQDIRCSPNGEFVYVTNKGNGTISIISTSTNTIVNTITGLVTPVGIAFNVDGTYAYVTDTAHNAVYVIQTSDNTIFDIILGFSAPSYSVVTPDKSFVYVTNSGNDTVSIIRTADNFITGSIPVPEPKSAGITTDGLYLYVGSDFGDVFKISTIDGSLLFVISGFQNPSNITIALSNSPADTVNAWQVVIDPLHPYNQITWQKPVNTDPISYFIYRDPAFTKLAAKVPGGTLIYNDMNRVIGQTYPYYVIANFANGFSTTLGSIVVSPTRISLVE